jgi:hypothetical protein
MEWGVAVTGRQAGWWSRADFMSLDEERKTETASVIRFWVVIASQREREQI